MSSPSETRAARSSRREVHVSEGSLDDQGRGEVSVKLPELVSVPSSLSAVVTARVSEQGGRGVTALTRVQVHPYPYYVGLRREGEGYAEPGKVSSFEYVTVGPDGKERASGGVARPSCSRTAWNSVLRRTPSGSYRYESRRPGGTGLELGDPERRVEGPSRFPDLRLRRLSSGAARPQDDGSE